MRYLLSLSMLGATVLSALQAQPQRRADQWEAVSKVDDFRRVWLEQTDSLDVCSLTDTYGFVDVPTASVSDGASALLLRWRSRECVPVRGRVRPRNVTVSALSVDGDEARVELTVSRSERLHREVFSLRRHPSPTGWTVVEMRVVGLLRRAFPPADEHP